ncbi:ABC transporter ATP-binding protein [Brachybacterium kimchii]|uniref:ABC transporter ATP-binding protein n=1 Tax=Brachybacterium kimchii TaxID=2942909 RepID=A0ABY4N5M1_9MICO|nr:ABC transporter ATP-binding protein [Brachybacterium kimchii]UQN28420.1 ABC transporter ATP-binding protein [Brachybacterium kimchii]
MSAASPQSLSPSAVGSRGLASPDAEAVITARGLVRRYGSGRQAFVAVDGIDLEIRRGELFGLLGTNGAGKTSTLEVLEGLARPDEGTVRVLGHDPRRERAAVRPQQGLMLQTGGFPADLTVSEALRMWCSTLSSPREGAELLQEVDLADRARTRISSLSGGEVRRLDLACAIAGDPQILFLDEPTTGLDPQSRAGAWGLIRRLTERGTTIVLTTHYLEEAEALSDRLALMHRGRIVREGTVDEVVAGHPSTIRFRVPVSAPALPDLHGAATREGERTEVTTDSLQTDLARLLRWADQHSLVLEGLDARAASLETVFLTIAHEGDPS